MDAVILGPPIAVPVIAMGLPDADEFNNALGNSVKGLVELVHTMPALAVATTKSAKRSTIFCRLTGLFNVAMF